MLSLKVCDRNLIIFTDFQLFLCRNTFGTVMKKTCQLCAFHRIIIADCQGCTHLHHTESMPETVFVQIFFQLSGNLHQIELLFFHNIPPAFFIFCNFQERNPGLCPVDSFFANISIYLIHKIIPYAFSLTDPVTECL